MHFFALHIYFFNSSPSNKLMVAVMIIKNNVCDFFLTLRRESNAVCRRINQIKTLNIIIPFSVIHVRLEVCVKDREVALLTK